MPYLQPTHAALVQRIAELEQQLTVVRQERDALNTTLHNVNDAIITLDLAFCIHGWNAGAERLYGWRADEVQNQSLPTLLGTRYLTPTTTDAARADAFAHGVWHGVVLQTHRDGHDLYVEATVRVVRADNGTPTGLVAINRDVSTQERISLTSVFEQIPAGLALYDTTQAFHCTQHNRRFLDFVGHEWQERGSVVGVPLRDLFDADSAAATAKIFTTVLETGKVFVIDDYAAVLLPDPQPRYYQWSLTPLHGPRGTITALLVSAIEITQYKRAQAEIRLRDRAIAAASSGIVIIENTNNYTIVYCNPAFEQLTSYLQGEAVGQSCRMLLGPASDPVGVDAMRQAFRTGQPCNVIVQTYRKDGTWFWNELTLAPVPDEHDRVSFFIGVFNDVTTREAAVAERLEVERQFQAAQRLESLGVLAGGIAHDFNNLLVSMLGNAELALLDLSDVAPAQASVQQIQIAAHRAADLTRQLLAYAGKGQIVFQELHINGLVEEMTHLIHAAMPRHVELRYHLGSGLPAVEADATQIRQVIMNLVINAAEAIGTAPGTVLVSTSVRWVDQTMLKDTAPVGVVTTGNYLVVEISDTGCGIDAATQARIFEPFFTTKTMGHGLGLAAVVGIVRSHNGGLWVASEVERGSTFTLLLPALQAAAALESQHGVVEAEWRGQGTVLVIDDEASVRAVTARMLERLGFVVITAPDGVNGLATFDEHEQVISHVLLDVSMPQLSGIAVLERLNHRGIQVPVVLMSGYAEENVSAQVGEYQNIDFLHKPFTFAELQRTLQRVNL